MSSDFRRTEMGQAPVLAPAPELIAYGLKTGSPETRPYWRKRGGRSHAIQMFVYSVTTQDGGPDKSA